jgi:hypothetical protein
VVDVVVTWIIVQFCEGEHTREEALGLVLGTLFEISDAGVHALRHPRDVEDGVNA